MKIESKFELISNYWLPGEPRIVAVFLLFQIFFAPKLFWAKTCLLYILAAIHPNSNGCCHYNQFLELHLHFANQILHFWNILAWLCLPLISKIPGQLSSQDWNEITFSCCQLFTAPPDICKGLLSYFTELTTLSTVNLQVTEAHSPQALWAALEIQFNINCL